MTTPDFLFNLTPGDIGYDIETYCNVFTFTAVHAVTKQVWVFEISFRRNDAELLRLFIDRCRELDCRWVGFNNIGFDYPVVHFIYLNPWVGVAEIYAKAMEIINSFNKFGHLIWESDHLVKQIDLFKIHHFDNKAKSTGLKILEFNMRMHNIEDLPFPVGIDLTSEQIDVLLRYNLHDVKATLLFLERSRSAIALRESLSEKFGTTMMNCSDVKIGEKILVHQIESMGIQCHEWVNGKKKKRQTLRTSINLGEVIFPYVSFERVEFENIRRHLAGKVITETKGVFKELTATVDGIDYHFGTGGIHASIESQIIRSDEQYQIVDVDVASFYPNLAIKNDLFPAHLGREFCDAYLEVYHTRKTYPKGSPENEAFKLALNGAYGGSNNEYSPFYDPFYTMSITINGQLLLCMLTEQLLKTPGLRMIQANTDGVTYLCPRQYIEHTRAVCRWWEQLTGLELEEAFYSRMFIRDVNSYIAEKEDGKLKRIGAYAHQTAEQNPGTRELPHHKDWSARVVQLAAEAALVRGEDIRTFITYHNDIFDFFLRTKVPRSASLEWGGQQVGNIVRYYISNGGHPLEKVMPAAGPIGAYKRANGLTDEFYRSVLAEVGDAWDARIHTKNKSTYQERRIGIHTGWKVDICNNLDSLLDPPDGGDWMVTNLNFEWYIKEAEKLVNTLKG